MLSSLKVLQRESTAKMRPRMVRRWLVVVGIVLCIFVFLLPVFNVTRQRDRVRWVVVDDVTQPLTTFKPPPFLWQVQAGLAMKANEIRELNASQWILQYSQTRPEKVGMPLSEKVAAEGAGPRGNDEVQLVAPQEKQSDNLTRPEEEGMPPLTGNLSSLAEKVLPKGVGSSELANRKDQQVQQQVAKVVTVKNTTPSVKKATPSVKKATPSVKKATPSVKKAMPSVKNTTPSVKKVTPSVLQQKVQENVKKRSAISRTSTLSSTAAQTATQQNTSDVPKLDFSIKSYLSFPLPLFTRSTVTQSNWVRSLQNYLTTLNSKQISVVTANMEHELLVVNWLISAFVVADKPLDNVLVLSLSKTLYDTLYKKSIPVIFVDPKSVINDYGSTVIRTGFSQVHIVRLTFFRLINHWGFDLVWYDSDAIVLKNPQPLFDKYPDAGLIGSEGRGPRSLASVWGRTICTGVLLMRSSRKMELYWENMAMISKHPFTDQGLVNQALKSQGVVWTKPAKYSDDMKGECQKSTLKAVILSEAVICRYTCDEKWRDHYYVWHKPAINRQRTIEKKMERAHDGHAWFLRTDWKKSRSSIGIEWLRDISENIGG